MKSKWIICLLTSAICVLGFFLVYNNYYVDKSDRVIRVGYIYVGDAGNAYTLNFMQAEQQIEEKYSGHVVSIPKYNIPEDQAALALDELIKENCDLIFGTSYGYENTIKEYAKNYPEIQFCMATGDNANKDDILVNYHTFMGKVYEGRYVCGVVAGLKLKEMIDSGIISKNQALIGYVGAFPYAEVISGYTSFLMGIRSIVPEATMRVKYSNSWNDYKVEKKMAKELIDEGCVIISQHSDTTGAAVACEESEKIVYHVGYNQNMHDIAPTSSLTGCKINWLPYMEAATRAVLYERNIEKEIDANIYGNDAGAGFSKNWVQMLDLNKIIAAQGTEEQIEKVIDRFKDNSIKVFYGDYTGVNPYDPSDTIDLNTPYIENANSSAPTFNYILDGIVTVEE